MIVEAQEIPAMVIPNGMVQLSSLNELVKIAGGLIKPVLHKVDGEKHIYMIIAEDSKYLYLAQTKSTC